MVMDAAPRAVTAREIDPTGRYKCPLCTAQTTGSAVDIGWVFCPMINERPICSGCCLDYQSVAVSEDFDGHPAREDFDNLSHRTGLGVERLRLVCLEHQESVLLDELGRNEYPHLESAMRELLARVRARIESLKPA